MKLETLIVPDTSPVEMVPLDKRSDDELMQLARKDSTLAFDTLVRRHQQMVFRIAAKYLGDETDAKDVTQSSFVEVYRYLEGYKPRGKFVSYLGRIVLNQCKMAVRARRYRAAAAASCAAAQAQYDRLPEDDLLAREQRQTVERALRTLSPKLREVVILRYAGELSYKEIASMLNLRMGTVKSRLFSGLKKIDQLMKAGTS